MKIAIVKPNQHALAHRIRGTGFYIRNLEDSLKKIDRKNTYISCSSKGIPKDVDLIHYPYFEPFFLTLPFFEKRKFIVTVHDLIPFVFPKNFPRGIKGTLRWEVQKRLLRNAVALITDSNSSKKDIIKFANINPQKIKTIYLSASQIYKRVDPSRVKSKYKLPKGFVLYVGDVTWNKNLPNLIEAVKKIKLPLVLVGKALIDEDFDRKNPWNKDLSRVIDLSKKYKNIIRLGFVEDNDLVALYNAATVFAMPSIYEGFGLPILEAMRSGCPVVTSRGGSIPEIAGDAALYADPYDIDDIANNIKKVFFDEKMRNHLREKGFEQSEKFSWEKTAKQTINVYETI